MIAAVNGATASISDLARNNFQSWSRTEQKFVEGFCASLLGSHLEDVASKFWNINNFGRALVTKLDDYFPYTTVTKWLGGGITSIFKSYPHRFTRNGVTHNVNLSVKKAVNGWEKKKIVIIGRSMDDRVKPFAQKLKNELGSDYTIVTFNADPSWDLDRVFLENQKFINDHKKLGYSFYDIGLDDTFPVTGDDAMDYGRFYLMELLEVFGHK